MVEELKQLLLRKPFLPFTVTLNSGANLEVTRPFQVAVGLTRFMYSDPDSKRVLEFGLNQIVSVEASGQARTA